MTEQVPSDSLATPKTDAAWVHATTGGPGEYQEYVPADFARAQERTIASHVDLMVRLKNHMERMGFCTREEEPYLEELDEAIQKEMQP